MVSWRGYRASWERGGSDGGVACGPCAQGSWLTAGWKEGGPPLCNKILHTTAAVALEHVCMRGRAGSCCHWYRQEGREFSALKHSMVGRSPGANSYSLCDVGQLKRVNLENPG